MPRGPGNLYTLISALLAPVGHQVGVSKQSHLANTVGFATFTADREADFDVIRR